MRSRTCSVVMAVALDLFLDAASHAIDRAIGGQGS